MTTSDSVQCIATLIDTAGVRVAEFAMGPGVKGDRHCHSSVKECCICLEGSLCIEREGESTSRLVAGQRIEVAPGVVHRVSNGEETSCRYLIVQGVGQYDFIRA